MSTAIFDLILTNNGKNLLANAANSGNKLTINTIRYGNSQEQPSETITSVGSLAATSRFVTQNVSLKKDRFEIHGMLLNNGGLQAGLIAASIGPSIIGVARLVTDASTQWPLRVVLRGASANAHVLNITKIAEAASILGDFVKISVDRTKQYLCNGEIASNGVLYGADIGNTGDDLCHFVNFFYDNDEMAATDPALHPGAEVYHSPTGIRMKSVNGAWEQQDGGQPTLLNILLPGRFYRSDITKTLYYCPGGGLVRLKKSQ